MKSKIIPILIICFFSCATQTTCERKWFPDNEDSIKNFGPISEYIRTFSTNDINVARNAYLNVLTFIREVIDAGHENLERAYRMDTPTVKRPAFENGKLTIIESTEMSSVLNRWDDVQGEYIKFAYPDVLWEFVLIYEHCNLYNILLNHWQSLTGELLGELMDTFEVYERLLQENEPLLIPKYFEVF